MSFTQISNYRMLIGMLSSSGAWRPPVVMGEDGLYIVFNDRVSHGGWLRGPRTATMPYGGGGGGLSSSAGDRSGIGAGLGSGTGLSLPRGTPNPYTLDHPLSNNRSSGNIVGSNGYNHYPF